MRNYYKDLDTDVLKYLYRNIKAKIEYNKAHNREYKSLETELKLITAVLISTKPRYDWQNRKDIGG